MNPSSRELERLWTEEVRYLHSLWRAGPPPNRSRNANVHTLDAPSLTKEKKRKKMEKLKDKKEDCGENPPTSSGADWPKCPSPPHVPAHATWEEAISAIPAPLEPSAEEVARFTAVRLQRSAAKACEVLLAVKDEGKGVGDQDETEMVGEEEAFLFFLDFFRRQEEVRRYYEGSAEKGEFFCFVCLGVGEKLSRKYHSCVSLVQHANAVTKTKTRGPHRAYGKAICRVMGWDFGRLPSIVLDMQGPLCPPAPPASSSQVNLAEDVGTDRQEPLSSVLAAS